MKSSLVNTYAAPSDIQGFGCFAAQGIKAGDLIISPLKFKKFRGYNHSCVFNAVVANFANGLQIVIALEDIPESEEITVDYVPNRNFLEICNCKKCRKSSST